MRPELKAATAAPSFQVEELALTTKEVFRYPDRAGKEIVLTVIEKEKTQEVLEAIKVAGKLKRAGTGIAL